MGDFHHGIAVLTKGSEHILHVQRLRLVEYGANLVHGGLPIRKSRAHPGSTPVRAVRALPREAWRLRMRLALLAKSASLR